MSATVLGIADDRALGCSVRVMVTEPRALSAAKAAVDRVLLQIDSAASRFRADSELSRLNARPAELMTVSPLLATAISAALRGAALTDGALDPTIGNAIRLAGYDGDFTSVPVDGRSPRLVASQVRGWKAVYFQPDKRAVMVPHGVELDLGATAKALAADLAAAAGIQTIASGGVLVSLGGDIAVAGEPPAGGWLVQISEDSGAPVQGDQETVSISSGGLATSGITVRRWTRGGVTLHHIIDPATGLPADSCWRTVTVAAATCVDANIASTAAIVMGPAAIPWLDERQLAARVVHVDGHIHRTAAWPIQSVS